MELGVFLYYQKVSRSLLALLSPALYHFEKLAQPVGIKLPSSLSVRPHLIKFQSHWGLSFSNFFFILTRFFVCKVNKKIYSLKIFNEKFRQKNHAITK